VEALEVPLIKQPSLNPLLKAIVLGSGKAPQATVIFSGAVIVGNAAGLTVMVLDTDARILPQVSVAVHVSVTVPPHALGVAVNVEALEVPLIKQPSLNPLLKLIVLGSGKAPQATVIFSGAVMVGNAAGLTVIALDTDAMILPQVSVAVQVSVTIPPHALGVAVKVEVFEVPLTKQPPLNPLLKGIVLGSGKAPQATVIFSGAVIVGNAAGLTWIILDALIVLPNVSVNVQDSVMSPPQAPDGD
jgi:hypothetical protein